MEVWSYCLMPNHVHLILARSDETGLSRAVGETQGRNKDCPQYCDACFSGEYPVSPADMVEQGFVMKAAE